MRKILSGLATVGLVFGLAACGSSEDVGVKANMGVTVGIAMPTDTSPRWIADGDNMKTQFEAMGYKVDLQNAKDKVETQVAQIKSMVAKGEKLLVIGSIDGVALKGVLAEAAQAKIKVISYDRLILESPNVDYYASFDNFRVGVQQGQLLADRLGLSDGKQGPFTIELFAGSSDDNNAKFFFDGAMSVLQKYMTAGKLVVKSGQTKYGKQTTTQQWKGDLAQKRMNAILNKYYKTDKLDAVLSPYDGMSIGVINALQSHGYTKATMPVISGQDAELKSIQAIIDGTQTGTVYKDTRELAKVTVQMGNALLTGATPITNDTTSYNNKVKVVPSYLLTPVAVDKSNYKTLLVDNGYYTKKQIETPVVDE